MIGAPPGYVGYEEGGYLTEAVRRRPYSVILMDEIEKAHPDVFNILLQVLDDGRLTDGHGRTVDFRNTLVVMTSNLGSSRIQELVTAGYDAMKTAVMDVVSQHFRPEFINRVDEMVVFHPLDQEQIKLIAGIQLGATCVNAWRPATLAWRVTDEALELLAQAGFDPVYGARPLKRAIQNEIENPLAQKILSGELTPAKSIRIEVKKRKIYLPVKNRLRPTDPKPVGCDECSPLYNFIYWIAVGSQQGCKVCALQ